MPDICPPGTYLVDVTGLRADGTRDTFPVEIQTKVALDRDRIGLEAVAMLERINPNWRLTDIRTAVR